MSSLAGPLEFNAPPSEFLDALEHLSFSAKTLLWYGLNPKTRKGYNTAVASYALFCATHSISLPWSASELALIEWITGRIFGSSMPRQGQIKLDTMQGYLSALRSYHVDYHFSIHSFASPRIDRILNGGRYLFPHLKKERLPITKDILRKITLVSSVSILDVNIDTAFKVAWAGFLRMGEFTYTHIEAQARTFIDIGLTRSDITFADDNLHAILRLKRSKTDVNHTGVEIILAATRDKACPVMALRALFDQDPQPRSAPLFCLSADGLSEFPRKIILDILQSRLQHHNISKAKSYTGHSFRKGAAQHASDNGMMDEHIQKLGRWTSRAFQLYFETSVPSLYKLSMRFQTGRAVSFNSQPHLA